MTEKFIEKAGLKRRPSALLGRCKGVIKVTPEQYEKFTSGRVVHAMGYPIWTPVIGPGDVRRRNYLPVSAEHIAVGMIVGPGLEILRLQSAGCPDAIQGAPLVKQFIEGGTVVEAGAKMIPEGG